MPDEAPVTIIVCFLILFFSIGSYPFFPQYWHLFPRKSPVVEVNFLYNHVSQLRIFVQYFSNQVGDSFYQGLLLFMGTPSRVISILTYGMALIFLSWNCLSSGFGGHSYI